MRTFCITLPETPERTDAAAKHFVDMDVPVESFMGIHGPGFGLFTTHTYELDHPGYGIMIPQRHVGLCLSHYMLWSALSLKIDWGDWALVLEDDAEFPEGWKQRFKQALEDMPLDADMLFIGSCNCGNKMRTHVAGEVYLLQWPQCTHAYVVARKALPLLLATQRKIWAPIDLALIHGSFPQLKVYTVLPRIVGQRGQSIEP